MSADPRMDVIRDALDHYLKAASSPHQWALTTEDAKRAVRAQAALEALAAPDADDAEVEQRGTLSHAYGPDDAMLGVEARALLDAACDGSRLTQITVEGARLIRAEMQRLAGAADERAERMGIGWRSGFWDNITGAEDKERDR